MPVIKATTLLYQSNETQPQSGEEISNTMQHPGSMVKALHYPYAALWVRAHDKKLDKLGEIKAIQCVQKNDLPPRTAPIPLTMTYKYKDDSQGNLVHRKARYPVRRDRMVPLTHFDQRNFHVHGLQTDCSVPICTLHKPNIYLTTLCCEVRVPIEAYRGD